MNKENTTKKNTTEKKAKIKSEHGKVTTVKFCECKCGATVKKHFKPGHDARLKSSLRKAAKKGDSAAIAELKSRKW